MLTLIRQGFEWIGVFLVIVLTLVAITLYFLVVEVLVNFIVVGQYQNLIYWLKKHHFLQRK